MFSNVWSENTALFDRLMEIHPIHQNYTMALSGPVLQCNMSHGQKHCSIALNSAKMDYGLLCNSSADMWIENSAYMHTECKQIV